MTSNIKIQRETETRITRARSRTDRQDKDDTDTKNEIKGFMLVGEDEFYDLTVSYTPEGNRDYYLLYVIYSTGDSYGREGGQIVFIDLYKEMVAAALAAAAIRMHERQYRGLEPEGEGFQRYSVPITYENGEKVAIHAPWLGHFESVESIEVKAVRLGGGTWRF